MLSYMHKDSRQFRSQGLTFVKEATDIGLYYPVWSCYIQTTLCGYLGLIPWFVRPAMRASLSLSGLVCPYMQAEIFVLLKQCLSPLTPESRNSWNPAQGGLSAS